MKKVLAGVIAFSLIGLGALAAESPTQAIEKRTAEFVAAWNRHDPKVMASVWAPNGDLINPFGRWAKGRAEVTKLLTDEQSGVMKATTFTTSAVMVRQLTPNLALADWDFTIAGMTAPDGSTMPTHKFHAANVWEKTAGTWFILAARPMLPIPVSGTAPR